MEHHKSNTIRIMVVSPDNRIYRYLEESLPGSGFEVVHSMPGTEFNHKAAEAHVAVIDRIHERTESACFEIATLKDRDPALPIIAVSEHSTDRDADVVNRGIFYYLAGYSGEKLLRVIRAAADSIENRHELEHLNKR